ncbi:MAG: hypothetical protein GEU99_01175 [Luteitalea sp.]|nr:hypothetical protein [Luteitalea sp.]
MNQSREHAGSRAQSSIYRAQTSHPPAHIIWAARARILFQLPCHLERNARPVSLGTEPTSIAGARLVGV